MKLNLGFKIGIFIVACGIVATGLTKLITYLGF